MNIQRQRRNRAGFSLVEVTIAILLLSMGVMVLFSLFPSAMREGELAITDSHSALFADFVMSGLRANAEKVTDWKIWQDPTKFKAAVSGDYLKTPAPDKDKIIADGTVQGPIVYSGKHLRYTLLITGESNSVMRTADLFVQSGKYGVMGVTTNFQAKSKGYHAEFGYAAPL